MFVISLAFSHLEFRKSQYLRSVRSSCFCATQFKSTFLVGKKEYIITHGFRDSEGDEALENLFQKHQQQSFQDSSHHSLAFLKVIENTRLLRHLVMIHGNEIRGWLSQLLLRW
jgi:hypothetical protein